MIPLTSKRNNCRARLRLKRYNRKISQQSRVGFNMLFPSIGTNAVYQNVTSSYCDIGNLRGACTT